MRPLTTIAAIVTLSMPILAIAQHEHHHQAADPATATPAAKTSTVPVLKQTSCPVTGKPISQEFYTTYEGQKVYFSSKDALSQFQSNPGKYLPALYKQWYPQSVQVKCPVMGDPVDGKTFVDVQGQHIALCCNDCPKKVQADPAKYIAKLKTAMTDQVHCPVTGKAIDPQASIESDGKTIYFASEEAINVFKASPAKYADALRPEVGIVARGATTADDLILVLSPTGDVSMHPRRHLKATSYGGKSYYVLGDDGVKEFQTSPAKYIRALDSEMKKLSGAQAAASPSDGHADHQPTPSGGQHGAVHQGSGHMGHNH